MRVTDSTLFQKVQAQLMARKKALENASETVTTGKKINRLEGDPSIVGETLRNQREEANLERYEKSLEGLGNRYMSYESNIQSTYDILARLKSVMVNLSNPSQDSDARTDMTNELEQAKESLLALANEKYNGQYMYSGARTDVEPFAPDGTYQGDSLVLEAEILPGVKMEKNITGEELFGGAGGGQNVFQLIDELQAAIQSGSPQEEIRNRLDDMDAVIEQTISARTEVGVRLSRIESSKNNLAQLQDNLAFKRQDTEDADYVSALTDYQSQELALQASMQVSADLLGKSLMDFLR